MKGAEHVFTTEKMKLECYDAALEDVECGTVWAYQARTWGYVDLDGRLLRGGILCRGPARSIALP